MKESRGFPSFSEDMASNRDRQKFIKDQVPLAVLYEQLAEECVELSHACLKKARILRGENPTPAKNGEVDKSVLEELTDLKVVINILGLSGNRSLYWQKIRRWSERLGY